MPKLRKGTARNTNNAKDYSIHKVKINPRRHYAYGDSLCRSCMVVRTMRNRFRRLDYARSEQVYYNGQ